MDFLRLPPPLRRALLQQSVLRRYLTTASYTPFTSESIIENSPAFTTLSNDPAIPQTLLQTNLSLTSTNLNTYNIALPPNAAQLTYASHFFTAAAPFYLWTAAHFRSLPASPHPEVAFLGRSNVGKSSLLNALFGRTNVRDAYVSKRPGRTRTMNGFGITGGAELGPAPQTGEREGAWKRLPRGGGCLVVVDMPGYGGGSREEWGKEVLKYIENRKQLRRTFVLVDAEHGLKKTDIQLLTHLRRQGLSYQIVLSKIDKILYPSAKPPGPERLSNGLVKVRALCERVRERLDREAGDGRQRRIDILCCSAEKGMDLRHRGRKIGVEEVRWEVLRACGVECDADGRERRRRRAEAIEGEDYRILE